MENPSNDNPDASISLGPAVFNVWVGNRGISRLLLPSLKNAINGRRKDIVDVSINRKLGLEKSRWVSDAVAFLESMFAGRQPSVLPLTELRGQTVFTRRVLESVIGISWGKTVSYKWVAGRIGRPNAARAVGQALGRNQVPLIIPCHRVIKEDGSIGGFGLGTEWKKWLLELERGGKGL